MTIQIFKIEFIPDRKLDLSITETMLRETIPDYRESHTKHINAQRLNVTASGMCSKHRDADG
jgi:hypothetical protein